MPDDRERLHELLLPWLDRHSLGARPDLPVVLLWAPRGAGTEEVLAHVAGRQELPSPVASIDGRALASGMRPHEVAVFSMWSLGKHIRGFGRIRFPRFLLGLAVVKNPGASLPQAARTQVVATVLGDAARLRTWLGDLLGTVAESAGAGAHAADLAAQTMEGLLEAARELQRRRSAPVAWYRDGLGEPFADPFQALAQLGRAEAQGEHALVDVTLCRAFLADIRAEYQAEFRWYARNRNPLLLIDAATRQAPARFVEHLVAAGGPAPLVVVAASGTRQSPRTGEPSGWQPTALADASATDWAARSARPGWARHYPVVFGIPTTSPRPAGLPPPGPRRHDRHVEFAQRLTAGHPGGFERVLRIARTGTDLRRVLDAPDPEHDPLDEEVLRWVVGDPQLIGRRTAVQLALLPDLGQERLAPVLHDAGNDLVRVTRFHRADMWVLRDAEGAPRLHPFARRALAHRLGRADVGGLSWRDWHAKLRDEALAAGDVVTALHHRLALGEVHEVADELGRMFRPGNQQHWFEDVLLEVTRAPLARPGRAADAGAHLDELLGGGGDGEGPVRARLVAALQLHTDPLGDPQHQLCTVVADELAALSRGARQGSAYLVNRAAEFTDCANRWHDEGVW